MGRVPERGRRIPRVVAPGLLLTLLAGCPRGRGGPPPASSPSVPEALPLAPPTGLTTEGGVGRIRLAWNASPGVTAYLVLRGPAGSALFETIGSTPETRFTDTPLPLGGPFEYRVRSMGPGGASPSSSGAVALPSAPPSAPGGLSASASFGRAVVAWSPVAGAAGYTVYRGSDSAGPFVAVGTTSGTQLADEGLPPGAGFYYAVAASNEAGMGPRSEAEAVVTPSPPPSPTGLTASGGDHRISLAWNASLGATGYAVWRARGSGGPYSSLGTTPDPSFSDTGLEPAVTYFYAVAAGNPAGTGRISDEAVGTTEAPGPPPEVAASEPPPSAPPPPPSGLEATGDSDRVTLSWVPAPGAAGYVILRSSAPGGPFLQVGNASLNRFVDASVVGGSPYFYAVQAYGPGGSSSGSDVIAVMAQSGALGAPPDDLPVFYGWGGYGPYWGGPPWDWPGYGPGRGLPGQDPRFRRGRFQPGDRDRDRFGGGGHRGGGVRRPPVPPATSWPPAVHSFSGPRSPALPMGGGVPPPGARPQRETLSPPPAGGSGRPGAFPGEPGR